MSGSGVVAWIGLGGNQGDVRRSLEHALERLDALPGTRVAGVSACYRSPAWGPVVQPDFVNAVCGLRTGLAASDLMQALLGVERECGRDREAPGALRWGPRTLDLDLLLYGDRVIDEPGLCVPHPRLHERAFVLVPLAELAPDLVVPGHGPVGVLLAGLDTEGVQALP